MRATIALVGLLSVVSLAAPRAAAAGPALAEEFLAICGANIFDADTAISVARARGYGETPVKPVGRATRTVGFARIDDASRYAAIVADAGGPGQSVHMTNCSVVGVDDGSAGADAVRRWAGMTSAMGEAETQYFFVDRNGQRLPIAPDNDVLRPALYEGGFSLLGISMDDQSTVITLVSVKLAK